MRGLHPILEAMKSIYSPKRIRVVCLGEHKYRLLCISWLRWMDWHISFPFGKSQRPYRNWVGECFDNNFKAADDDAGKLQPVFLKRLYLLHICIFSFFSFQRKFNNHLKILTTTIWSTISRFYQLLFHFEVKCSFFTFLFSTRKRLIRFHFFFLQDVW